MNAIAIANEYVMTLYFSSSITSSIRTLARGTCAPSLMYSVSFISTLEMNVTEQAAHTLLSRCQCCSIGVHHCFATIHVCRAFAFCFRTIPFGVVGIYIFFHNVSMTIIFRATPFHWLHVRNVSAKQNSANSPARPNCGSKHSVYERYNESSSYSFIDAKHLNIFAAFFVLFCWKIYTGLMLCTTQPLEERSK